MTRSEMIDEAVRRAIRGLPEVQKLALCVPPADWTPNLNFARMRLNFARIRAHFRAIEREQNQPRQ